MGQVCEICAVPLKWGKRFCSSKCYGVWRQGTVVSQEKYVYQGNVSEVDRAWLACLLDTEGWIGIARLRRRGGRSGHYLRSGVGAGNTNIALMARFCEILSSFGISKTVGTNKREYALGCFEYSVILQAYKWVEPVLKAVLPFLIAKRKQAELVLKLISLRQQRRKGFCQKGEQYVSYTDEELKLWRKCKDLNQLGTRKGRYRDG